MEISPTFAIHGTVFTETEMLDRVYRRVPNKWACLNKRAPSTLRWNILLKIGQNWSKMIKFGSKTTKNLQNWPGCVSTRWAHLFGTLQYHGLWEKKCILAQVLFAVILKDQVSIQNNSAHTQLEVLADEIWTTGTLSTENCSGDYFGKKM